MVSEKEAAKYPFIRGAGEVAEKYGLSFEDLTKPENKGIINRAIIRINESLVRSMTISNIDNVPEEIISFAVAMMYVMRIGDKWLAKKFAYAESLRAWDFLQQESKNRLIYLSDIQFGWDVKPNTSEEIEAEKEYSGILCDYKIYFANYLDGAKNFHEPEWKLINRIVRNGYVYITKKNLARLMRSMINDMIHEKLSRKVDVSLPQELEERVKDIIEVIERTKPKTDSIYPAQVTESRFPPCIRHLLVKLRSGTNLSHNERFLLTTFLLKIGMDVDEVIDMYDVSPDFKRSITKYQVEFLRGKDEEIKYAPPKCDNIRSQGMCKRDESCHWFHPLSYYEKI